MKTSSVLAALTAFAGTAYTLAIRNTAITCSGGPEWPSTEEARNFIHDACYNQGGMFTGYYEPGQTKAMCPRSGSGMTELFQITNLNTQAGFDLGNDDCYHNLEDLISSCQDGGENTNAGWRFVADPAAC